MSFPDITPSLKAEMPELRGRLLANQSLAELTWFRVGGPAQVLFTPAMRMISLTSSRISRATFPSMSSVSAPT